MTGNCRFFGHTGLSVLILACQVTRADISYTTDPGNLLTGNVIIPAEMGVTRGSNLLHSFDQFSINSSASATFTGPDIINNIIARVTGINPSLIEGLLRSEIVDADLFLLNPNGIMFGDGARVDIDGSLYLSTANTVKFEDGSLLAVSDTGKSTLTTAPPSAFGFNDVPAPITFDHALIDGRDGSGITVVGGDILLEESVLYVKEGNIDLVALGGAAEIALDPATRLTPESLVLGRLDILDEFFLTDDAEKQTLLESRFGDPLIFDLDVRGDSGGEISIIADTMVFNAAGVTATSQGIGNAGVVSIQGGSLVLQSGAVLAANARGGGKAGLVDLNLASLILDDAEISVNSFSSGNAGSLKILADEIDVLNESLIYARSFGSGGIGGHIQLSGKTFFASGGSFLSTSSESSSPAGALDLDFDVITVSGAVLTTFASGGRAGDINLMGNEFILDGGFIAAETDIGNTFSSGDIRLDFDKIDASSSALISARSFGSGAAGSVTLSADDVLLDFSTVQGGTISVGIPGAAVLISSTLISADSSRQDAVSLSFEADQMNVTNGSLITSQSRPGADAGDISIAGGILKIDGFSSLSASSGNSIPGSSTGDAGDLNLDVEEITLQEGALLNTTSFGTGKSGDVNIHAARVLMTGGAVIQAASQVSGSAGNINIEADELTIRAASITTSSFTPTDSSGRISLIGRVLVNDQAVISADAGSGTGEGGAISLAFDEIEIINGTVVTAISFGSGRSGDIQINADQLLIDFSTVRSPSVTAGRAGDIDLTAESLVISGVAQVDARTFSSDSGGRITLAGGDARILENSRLDAGTESGFGNAGSIGINVEDLTVDGGAALITVARGFGDSGDINIDAGRMTVTAATITAKSELAGAAGNIMINSRELLVNDGSIDAASLTNDTAGSISIDGNAISLFDSLVSTESFFSGGAGAIDVNASTIMIDSTLVTADSWDEVLAGTVTISADDLQLVGSVIDADAHDAGAAGRVVLEGGKITAESSFISAESLSGSASGLVRISGQAFSADFSDITVRTESGGKGGRIVMDIDEISLTAQTRILANARSNGDGGLIELLGGELLLDDASTLDASGGGIGVGGHIQINISDIEVLSSSVITVGSLDEGFGSAGTILINGEKLRMSRGFIEAFSANGNGGSIELNIDDIEMLDGSFVQVPSLSDTSSADAGSIIIRGNRLSMDKISSLGASTNGSGDGGDIHVDVDFLLLSDVSFINSTTGGAGRAGDVTITASVISLTDSSQIQTRTFGSGDGGNLMITTGGLHLSDFSNVSVSTFGAGDAGALSIIGSELTMAGLSQINADSWDLGGGGDLLIEMDNMHLDASTISVSAIGDGLAGELTIKGDSLIVENFGRIVGETRGLARGGNLAIDVNLLILDGSQISVGASGEGDAGGIIISSHDISLLNSSIDSEAFFDGDGGNVSIDFTGRFEMTEGSSVSSSAFDVNQVGSRAGTLAITGGTLTLNKSRIESESLGAGDAGNVNINLTGDLILLNSSVIDTQAFAAGGGNITLNVQDVLQLDDSAVTASTFGAESDDSGGNITIDPVLVALRESRIDANAQAGDGGAIFITADNFIADRLSVIEASSQRGNDGEVTITSADNSVSGSIGTLNAQFANQEEVLKESCAARVLKNRSSLVVERRRPSTPLPYEYREFENDEQVESGC